VNGYINSAIAQAEVWHQEGLKISISINVSANHLLKPGFHDFLRTTLIKHPNVPPSYIELEILESAAITDLEQAVSILHECRKLGIHFALDDFGTGYSSLTYLRRLPVDTLKIDQSFVRDMLEDSEDLSIVRSVIQLASVFGKQVIAEGVESLAHCYKLEQLGCSNVQGYGIAKPMNATVLPEWCKTWPQTASLHKN
jgi:EAL domain-containing protein (putative c-di-GMP-specific phosphodiesterase class I)